MIDSFCKAKRTDFLAKGHHFKQLIQKREVIHALDRAADDMDFWRDLWVNGSEALEGYRISNEAKSAIISGDLRWINENVGELTQKQLMFILKRLEREVW